MSKGEKPEFKVTKTKFAGEQSHQSAPGRCPAGTTKEEWIERVARPGLLRAAMFYDAQLTGRDVQALGYDGVQVMVKSGLEERLHLHVSVRENFVFFGGTVGFAQKAKGIGDIIHFPCRRYDFMDLPLEVFWEKICQCIAVADPLFKPT